MPPRSRVETLEKIADALDKALSQALTDKVTRAGRTLSPYYSKRLQTLLGELNGATDGPTTYP